MGSELTVLEKVHAEMQACAMKKGTTKFDVMAVFARHMMRQRKADDDEIDKMAEEMGGI